jgi:hypothetical protein
VLFRSKTFNKFLSANGLKNVFHPIESPHNNELNGWIDKSKEELIRFTNFLVLLKKYEREPVDDYTCQAIHFTIASCSESIVFSLFNIFAILTKSDASFYDTHICDYFTARYNLNQYEMEYLSFSWHVPIQKINTLVYSVDEKFLLYNSINDLAFEVVNSVTSKSQKDIICSVKYFAVNLLNLLSTIDLLATLLFREIKDNYSLTSLKQQASDNYLRIENISELLNVFGEIQTNRIL